MNWIQRTINGWLGAEVKENPANRAILVLGLGGPVFTGANYTALANEGYVINADVYACIREITRAAQGIKWNLYDAPPDDDKRKKVEDHELLDLIRRPNERMGWGYFFEQYIGYLMMAGNSYVVRNGPSINKPPTELWPLRPDRMRIKKGNAAEPIAGFTYSSGGAIIEFLPDRLGQQVLHTKLFHPTDDWYGLSPLQAASRNVDQSNEIQRWNVALMQNSGRPSGALSTEKTLTQEQFDRMKGELRDKYTGSMHAGMPMVLEGGLSWERLSLTPGELDWLGGDERASRKICSAFNVPPELIGIRSSGGLNDSNFKDARKAFYLETILPLLDYVRDDFNSWLCPLFVKGNGAKALFMDYDKDDIEAIQEDRDVIYNRNNAAVKSSWMMVSEARAKAGLPEVPGMDVFLVPTGIQLVDGNGQVVLGAAPKTQAAAPGQQAPGQLPGKTPPAQLTQGDDTSDAGLEPFGKLNASAAKVLTAIQKVPASSTW